MSGGGRCPPRVQKRTAPSSDPTVPTHICTRPQRPPVASPAVPAQSPPDADPDLARPAPPRTKLLRPLASGHGPRRFSRVTSITAQGILSLMRQHEELHTRRYLSQYTGPTRIEVTIPGTRRAVDGAVWLSGAPWSFDGVDLLLVQTKRWLTSSVLGQALLSAELALLAGARGARCVALVGEGQPVLEDLARRAPFADFVEVVVAPDLFEGGSYPGAPAWSQRAVASWLGEENAEQKVPMYEGAERRAKGYDRACAVVSRGPFKVIVNTQKHLGMSVLGRAIVAGRLLDRPDAILENAVVVRRAASDLEDLAARHGVVVEIADEAGGAWSLLDRFTGPRTERLNRLLHEAADSSDLLRKRPYGDGGIEEPWLFARLNRAAMNHLSGGTATTSRYGIWAMTCRDHVAEALRMLEEGEEREARALLVKAANALTTFAEIQRMLDPMCIAPREPDAET